MHYKNGRLAKVGDPVVGTVFNTSGIVAGTLISLTPGPDACSCYVMFIVTKPALDEKGENAARPMMAIDMPTRTVGCEQHGHFGENHTSFICADYTECKNLFHAEDAVSVNAEGFNRKVEIALYRISLMNEEQPAGEIQSHIATMLSDLSSRVKTDWKFPQPCEWLDRPALPNQI